RREGGLIPLTRLLRKAGLKGLWAGRLRAVAREQEMPAWHLLGQVGQGGGGAGFSPVDFGLGGHYRIQLRTQCASTLGIELRLLIAEVANTLREFSPRLGFNYSVLVRDLQRIDRDIPIKWYHVERILQALGLMADDDHWREMRALWLTASERKKKKEP